MVEVSQTMKDRRSLQATLVITPHVVWPGFYMSFCILFTIQWHRRCHSLASCL